MKVWGVVSKLTEENRYMRILVVILAVTAFVEAVMIYNLSGKQKIVFIPPKVTSEFWIAGDTVSSSYIENVALYIADRVLSVSPENVDYSLDAVMPLMTTEPSLIKAIKDNYIDIQRVIKSNNVYQIFYPIKVTVGKGEAQVFGTLRKLVGNLYSGEEKIKLVIGYQIRDGRFTVTKLEVKSE